MKATVSDELIQAISEVRFLFPDWRMGQLISNLALAAGATDAAAVWDMEDDRLLSAARRLIERNRGRGAEISKPSAPPLSTTASPEVGAPQATPTNVRNDG